VDVTALDQAVVVCGGQGTRLASILGDLPKALVPVADRALLHYLLTDLAAAGVSEVLLLAGPGGESLREAAGVLAPAGLAVHTEIEPYPRGTAGALHPVAHRLRERFLYVLGDVFTALDWSRLAAAGEANGGLGTLLVHRSSHPEDSDLLALDDGDRLAGWVGRGPGGRSTAAVPTAALTNAGVAVLHRRLLDYVPPDRATDFFGEVIPRRVDARAALYGYRSAEYVKDLGTPERLREVDGDVRAGRVKNRAEAVLLDRDGVLTAEVGPVTHPDQLRLLPGAAEAVGRLNRASIRTAVVTNQAVVARGLCSALAVDAIHERLAVLLAEAGAHLDGVYVCPHHPETHHGEGDPALRGPCRCRKPSVGLVESALAELSVPAWRAVVVGDATVDLQLAANAGLPAIALDSGLACGDAQHPARPVWRFADLAAAARWLCGTGD
jgi:histidinol-phosphate phosphatase family protein